MDAAGGIDFLVRIAERIIRANPKYVTIVAPLTTWSFTFLAGTGHIVYPLLPVIYETAHQSGIRRSGRWQWRRSRRSRRSPQAPSPPQPRR
jgi:anaerobic C4-dicarboxylate transporter